MPVLGSHFSEYQPESIPQVAVDGGYNPFDPVTSAGSATDEYGAVGRGASTGSATELGGPANEFGGRRAKDMARRPDGKTPETKDSGNMLTGGRTMANFSKRKRCRSHRPSSSAENISSPRQGTA